MSQRQKWSSVFDDSLATIIIVTTPRNEPSCDTLSSEPNAWKKKTHSHIAVSAGRTLRKHCLACLGIWEVYGHFDHKLNSYAIIFHGVADPFWDRRNLQCSYDSCLFCQVASTLHNMYFQSCDLFLAPIMEVWRYLKLPVEPVLFNSDTFSHIPAIHKESVQLFESVKQHLHISSLVLKPALWGEPSGDGMAPVLLCLTHIFTSC